VIELLKWPLLVVVFILAWYTLWRLASSAVFRSWWESKKLFDEGGFNERKRKTKSNEGRDA